MDSYQPFPEPLKKSLVDLEQPSSSLKPLDIVDSADVAADAAQAKRRKNLKLALVLAAGIVLAVTVALAVGLTVTYVRHKDSNSGSGQFTDPAQSTTPGTEGKPKSGVVDPNQQPQAADTPKPVTYPANLTVTLLDSQNAEKLGVESWPVTENAAGDEYEAEWTAETYVYVSQGKVLVTTYAPGNASSTATVTVTTGQMVTIPANTKTTWSVVQLTWQHWNTKDGL